MGGFANIGRALAEGVDNAVGNTAAASQVEGQFDRQRQQQSEARQAQIAPLQDALRADQTRLALYANPDDPTKPLDAKEAEYNQVHDRMAQTIGQIRSLYGGKPQGANPVEAGVGNLLDKLHITNHLKNHVANVRAENAKKYADQTGSMTSAYTAAAMPYEQTAEGQKLALQEKLRKDTQATKYANYMLPDGKTVVTIDENHQTPPEGAHKIGNSVSAGQARSLGQGIGVSHAIIAMQSSGQKYIKEDGTTPWTIEELQKFPVSMKLSPLSLSGKLVYVPSDQNESKFVVGNKVYLKDQFGDIDLEHPMGDARTGSTSVDAFGVTTRTAPYAPGATGAPSLNVSTPSSPGIAPPSAAAPHGTPSGQVHRKLTQTAADARSGSATHQLDVDGHIPSNAGNPGVVEAANQILDGMDINKITIPQKDRPAAEKMARDYGWKGQGLFTPREVLQLKEGATVIQQLINSPALKVLDEGTISQLPMLGQGADPSKEGFLGRLGTKLASGAATPQQQEFLRYWRQLDALAIGLRGLVQTGRATQAQVERLIAELPNPYNTTSSDDAKKRLEMVQNELRVAANTGKLSDVPLGKQGNDSQKVLKYNPDSGKLE